MLKKAYEDPSLHRKGDPACQWCEEPSTASNPVKEYRSEIGTRLFRHEQCEKEANPSSYYNPIENYIASSRKIAVYPILSCDNPHCDNEIDTGDENETDKHFVVGEPCLDCLRGNFEYRSASAATTIKEYTKPTVSPIAAENYPRTFRPPQPEPKGNLNENNDADPPGSGPGPVIKETSTNYQDLRYHLISNHGYKDNWLQGYNPRVLLGLHLQHHKEHHPDDPLLNHSHY